MFLTLEIGFNLLVLWKQKSRAPLLGKPGFAC